MTVVELPFLQDLAVRTFVDTYARYNTPENMQAYIAKAFNPEQLTAELGNTDCRYYFACLEEKPVGYVKLNFGPAQTEPGDDDSLEIERIYVDPTYKGRGIGRALIDQAEAVARAEKLAYIWLGVWEKNEAAVRFYERMGFRRFATHTFTLGDEEQLDWLMRKKVGGR